MQLSCSARPVQSDEDPWQGDFLQLVVRITSRQPVQPKALCTAVLLNSRMAATWSAAEVNRRAPALDVLPSTGTGTLVSWSYSCMTLNFYSWIERP